MKRHSRGRVLAESLRLVWWLPRQQFNIRLILRKYQFRKTKKGPNSDLYHPSPHSHTNYNIFQQSVTQWSPSNNNYKQKQTHTWNSGSNSVNKFILKAKFWHNSVIASTQRCFNTPTDLTGLPEAGYITLKTPSDEHPALVLIFYLVNMVFFIC